MWGKLACAWILQGGNDAEMLKWCKTRMKRCPGALPWGWSCRIQGNELYDISNAKKARSRYSNALTFPLFPLHKFPSHSHKPGSLHRGSQAIKMHNCLSGEKGIGQCSLWLGGLHLPVKSEVTAPGRSEGKSIPLWSPMCCLTPSPSNSVLQGHDSGVFSLESQWFLGPLTVCEH